MNGRVIVGWNQFFAFLPLFAASNPAESVFWPGCAAMKLDPGIIKQAYRALKHINPELGFSGWCCAKPTYSVGSRAQIQKRRSKLDAYFSHAGIKRLYTLCPNCRTALAENSDVEVFSAWTLLAEYAKLHTTPDKDSEPAYILHDPCGGRADVASQKAARDILDARGVAYSEFERRGCATECCGRKDMLFLTNPAASKKLLRKRLDEAATLPVATYCESCVEAFRSAGHKSVHLLEILFGKMVRRSVSNRIKNARWIRDI